MKFLFAFLLITIIGFVAAIERDLSNMSFPEVVKAAYADHFNDFLKVFGLGKKSDLYNWGNTETTTGETYTPRNN